MAGNFNDSANVGIQDAGKGLGVFTQMQNRIMRRQALRGMQKHGLVHAPMIHHSRDGSGTQPPRFGVGQGGFKAGGF